MTQVIIELRKEINMGQKLKNMKISKRLMLSYAVVLVLLVIGILVSVFNLVSIGNKIKTFYNGPFTVAASANIVNASFEQMQKSVFRAIGNDDMGVTTEAIDNAKKASETIQAQMPVIQQHFLGDQTVVENLQAKLQELAPMREAVLEMAAKNENAEAAKYMEENNIKVIKEAQKYLNELIENANEKGDALIDELNRKQITAIIMLVILGAASIGVSLAFAKFITDSISVPVEEIEAAAANLSKGILDNNITYDAQDELGNLAKSMSQSMEILQGVIRDISYLMGEIASGNFNVRTRNEKGYVGEFQPVLTSIREMNTNISDTLSQINDASNQVQVGSNQMAQNAQGLAEGATEQAGAVEELNATVEDVANTAKKSADDTREAYGQISTAAQKAEESRQKMTKLIEAMGRIDATSKEIENIIAAIEDIASQTNLLSLNASIEAARAGEAGKGFAVVADQIGKLASDSAHSAVDTRELIGKTLEEIKVGNDITQEASKFFAEIIEQIRDFADIAKVTSEHSDEQYGSLQQIREGIEQISGVVQSNSAAAEESSATSEELAAQADNLRELVEQFKLKQV